MLYTSRIFIIGHPGAGRALLGKSLAEKLGWSFINADFELEFKIGEPIDKILGQKGVSAFQKKYQEILDNLPEKTIVSIDTCIASMNIDLSNNFLVYLKASTPVQIARVSRNQMPLLETNLESFFDNMHRIYDEKFEALSDLVIDSDDNELELHVKTIMDNIQNEITTDSITLEQKDIIMMHNQSHTPIKLTKQQALCLKLLAHGKSSKQIARALNLSYRTVEGHFKRLLILLGCSSNKELIKLYFYKP